MKPVLVTGAFGEVGTRCTRILLDRGRTVVALDLRTEKSKATAAELPERRAPAPDRPACRPVCSTPTRRHPRSARIGPATIADLAAVLAPPVVPGPGTVAHRQRRGHRESVMGQTAALPEAPCSFSRPALRSTDQSNRRPDDHRPTRGSIRIDPVTAQDKVLAEAVSATSGLPYAILRLAGLCGPGHAVELQQLTTWC